MSAVKIQTNEAPAAIGPYSQAVAVAGGFLFTSGQIPIDPATGEVVEGNIALQTEQVFKNLCAVLVAGGMSFKNVVKTTCFLASMDDFTAFNVIYSKYFEEAGVSVMPARSCVAVKTLPKNVLCEVEAIAVV